MRKLLLQNTLATQILIYGGLALIMWPTMLRSLGVVTYGSTSSTVFLYVGLAVALVGGGLNFYQQRQAGQAAFRSYLFRFGIGLAIVAVMMMTGLVRTPAFLQNLF